MPEPLPYSATYPKIPAEGLTGREGNQYVPDPHLVVAANAALALGRPLLLTGEAGCGKTDFAYAASSALTAGSGADSDPLLECYVRSDSTARDLLYHYDAIRRFGDAQHGGPAGKERAQDPRHYLKLEALGRGLMSRKLRVVLIDEIDKAPRDLPNDLLRELDQGHFEIDEIPPPGEGGAHGNDRSGDGDAGPPIDPDDAMTFRHLMKRPAGPRPFVVITSNVERQLPDPFLRRCVFFHIPFPGEEHLRQILQAHFSKGPAALLLDRGLEVFTALRKVRTLTKKPTTSELIDWVETLATVLEPGAVKRALDAFGGGKELQGRKDLPWTSLPALGCLVKLREDLERLEHATPG